MAARLVSAGDPVKVFDAYNGRRHGQPEDGWDGEVVKVGTKLVHIRYGRYDETEKFRLDTQVVNDQYERLHFRTMPQMEELRRSQAALALLATHGLRLDSWRTLPVDVLEQLAAVLTAYDKTKDGT